MVGSRTQVSAQIVRVAVLSFPGVKLVVAPIFVRRAKSKVMLPSSLTEQMTREEDGLRGI